MSIRVFDGALPADVARALAEFEAGFSYPLGAGATFRISHGEDYTRFFRAMGESVCIVAERGGQIAGTISGAIVELTTQDGGSRRALYVGDLKIAIEARGGRVLLGLSRAMETWGRERADAAFSVVMDGTAVTPSDYSGRAGVPAFEPLARIELLRIECAPGGNATGGVREISARDASVFFRALAGGVVAHPGGRPADRSELVPAWLVLDDGSACGRLEDTRRAKRLLASDGREITSGHLACFAARTPADAARFLAGARHVAAERGLPAIFAAVDAGDAPSVSAALVPLVGAGGTTPFTLASATVFGHGLPRGARWNVNPSEI